MLTVGGFRSDSHEGITVAVDPVGSITEKRTGHRHRRQCVFSVRHATRADCSKSEELSEARPEALNSLRAAASGVNGMSEKCSRLLVATPVGLSALPGRAPLQPLLEGVAHAKVSRKPLPFTAWRLDDKTGVFLTGHGLTRPSRAQPSGISW